MRSIWSPWATPTPGPATGPTTPIRNDRPANRCRLKKLMVRTCQDPQVQATSSAAEASITAMRKAKSPLALWFVLIVSLAGFYGWCVLRGDYAYRLSWKRDQLSLQRAITLHPRDPATYDLLGQYLMWKAQ